MTIYKTPDPNKPPEKKYGGGPNDVAKCYQCKKEIPGGVVALAAHYKLEHPEIDLTK